MSLSVALTELGPLPPARVGLPVVPHWSVARPGLDRLLDRGAGCLITVVSAPTGFGKTQGVAAWVAGPTSPAEVVWMNLARGGAEPDRVWRLLRRALQHTSGPHVPPLPAGAPEQPDRVRGLVELGEAIAERAPLVVVLDGFPTGIPGRLGSELEIVLEHAGRGLRLVLLSRAEPALDLHRFTAAGEVVRVGEADLVMTAAEISQVLRLGGGASDSHIVTAVAARTQGWACGVRRTAVALQSGASLSAALDEADRALEDYLVHEVLGAMPAPVRRLVVWTSVVEVVPADLIDSVLATGAQDGIDRAGAATGLLWRNADDSLTCHPLLRATARALLPLEHPDDSRAARTGHQRLVGWLAAHGRPEAAAALGVAARDWSQAAATLVAAHAVPRVMAGTADDATLRIALLPEIQAAEPLLHAAVALSRQDVPTAEAALAASTGGAPAGGAAGLALAFLQLGVARHSGRPLDDPDLPTRTQRLLARTSVAERVDLGDLAVCLDAYAGAVELSAGRLDQAVVALTRGADQLADGRRGALDCGGQLAVLEAYRGNLGEATRRAQAVLSAAAGAGRVGVAHALVAQAWAQADHAQLASALVRLVQAADGALPNPDPWLPIVRRLVEARVLIASGQPDEAIRVVAACRPTGQAGQAEWLSNLVTVVSAEAALAAGEPQQALAAVTVGLPAASPERAVLTAAARREIGDVRGAVAAMTSAGGGLLRAPRATQVLGWVLEARLAVDRGQVDLATQLVDRALRAASAEELRRPLLGDAQWLRWFLDRDGSALRERRPFVLSLCGRDPAPPRPRPAWVKPDPMVSEPLTERETQVLELLAQMCSTDEIAAELFVSANTVKTHLKGIFRKYAVNRRVDAVRRGRELGVCSASPAPPSRPG